MNFRRGLPGIHHQGLIPQGPCQQVERLARFAETALGQSVLVQGIAAQPDGRAGVRVAHRRKRTPHLEFNR